MRWPTFWEAFWFAAILIAPAIAAVVGMALRYWFGLPAWIVLLFPVFGIVALFAVVEVLKQR